MKKKETAMQLKCRRGKIVKNHIIVCFDEYETVADAVVRRFLKTKRPK